MTNSRRVLVTGGAGSIAAAIAEAPAQPDALTLLDLPGRFTPAHAAWGTLVERDLSDLDGLAGVFDGIDTVIHLGGQRSPSTLWDDLLPANIVGTYNMTVASVAAGVRHIVYASSVHAVSGYPADQQLRESDLPMPGDLYGVTKCFGEALGAFVAGTEDIAFTALRIGAFQPVERLAEEDSGWMLRDYCAPADLVGIIRAVVDGGGDGFRIFNAASANKLGRLPMDKASIELGFTPSEDSFALSAPYRAAAAAVGGIDDKPILSGIRQDVQRLGDKEK